MNFLRYGVTAFVFCLSRLYGVVAQVAPLILEPVMSFIRDAPAAAGFLFRLPLRLIAFAKISILKPVYRESYETHGLSLFGARS